jgi:hypothetical protein
MTYIGKVGELVLPRNSCLKLTVMELISWVFITTAAAHSTAHQNFIYFILLWEWL